MGFNIMDYCLLTHALTFPEPRFQGGALKDSRRLLMQQQQRSGTQTQFKLFGSKQI